MLHVASHHSVFLCIHVSTSVQTVIGKKPTGFQLTRKFLYCMEHELSLPYTILQNKIEILRSLKSDLSNFKYLNLLIIITIFIISADCHQTHSHTNCHHTQTVTKHVHTQNAHSNRTTCSKKMAKNWGQKMWEDLINIVQQLVLSAADVLQLHRKGTTLNLSVPCSALHGRN